MKSIKVVAKTDKGQMALEQHTVEVMKLEKKKKLMFKMLGYQQELIDTNPYTIELRLTKMHLRNMIESADIVRKINEALNLNGAIKDRDYFFIIEE